MLKEVRRGGLAAKSCGDALANRELCCLSTITFLPQLFIGVRFAMNSFPQTPRYICRQCIRHYSRKRPAILGSSRVPYPSQLAIASQDELPNGRLRIKKHWNGDTKDDFVQGRPNDSELHLKKTQSSYHLDIDRAEEQGTLPKKARPSIPDNDNVHISAAELLRQSIQEDDSLDLTTPKENRRQRRQREKETKKASDHVEANPTVVVGPFEPEVHEVPSRMRLRRSTVTPTRNVSRREAPEELQPSTPSLPLGSSPGPEVPLKTSPKPDIHEKASSEHAATHVSLYHNNLQDFHWYWESLPPTIAQKSQANHFFTNHGKNAKLLRSVAQFRLFPESDVPEVAFVGRSNVGKSSLLNTIVNADIKALLARTSATPGFTKTMNLYGLGAGNGVTIKQQPSGRDKIIGKNGLTIVDMPGYGEGSLAAWGTEILKYIRSRKQLRRVFVLIDAQHGIKDKDRSLLATLRLSGVSHQIILSKLDKIYIPQAKDIKRYDGKSPRRLTPKGTLVGLRQTMEDMKSDIQPPVGGGALGEILGVSAETVVDGKRLGIDHVRYAVLKAVGLDETFKKDVSTPWGQTREVGSSWPVRSVKI